jgi:putative transposase
LVYHAFNRGNNRADVFTHPGDQEAFLHALSQTRERYPFELFGYCLMTNHVHLLLRPADGQSISRIMQSLTVAHTWRYHKAHGTVGHVWQGRFKSPLIADDDHLVVALRYVEGNPLRAGMVSDLAQYPWCSYPVHGLARSDPLVSPLPGWDRLGRDEAARQAYWRRLVHEPLTDRELRAVRDSVRTGRPLGPPAWVQRTARALGLNLLPRPRGRPRKQAEK